MFIVCPHHFIMLCNGAAGETKQGTEIIVRIGVLALRKAKCLPPSGNPDLSRRREGINKCRHRWAVGRHGAILTNSIMLVVR